MKKVKLLLFPILLFLLTQSFPSGAEGHTVRVNSLSDTTQTELKVWGTAACKTTIENIVKARTGVTNAVLDCSENNMTLTYMEGVLDMDTLLQELADAGYDAGMMRATSEAYDGLSADCKYTRPTY